LEALSAFSAVLSTPELGMLVMAPTRFGKTTFIDFLCERFKAAGTAAVLRSVMTAHRSRNEVNRFWRRLRGEEEDTTRSASTGNPKTTLLRHVENDCDLLKTRVVVFALDEAQNLSMSELDLLKELSENLLNMGLKPFMLLVGQMELDLLVTYLRDGQRQDILQRFMLHRHVFRGLRAPDEVRAFLRHTDTAVWPEGSSTTYTQHFVPELWKKGWRIQSESSRLWQAMEQHADAIGFRPDPLEFGTQFFAQAQLALLSELQRDPSLLSKHSLFQAVAERSGLHLSQVAASATSESKSRAARKWLQSRRR
jgi:hypothetical protein